MEKKHFLYEDGKFAVIGEIVPRLLPRIENIELYANRESPNVAEILAICAEMKEILMGLKNL